MKTHRRVKMIPIPIACELNPVLTIAAKPRYYDGYVGLLWYDPSPKLTLADKVREAARRHLSRTGHQAHLCLINPATGELPAQVDDILVQPCATVLRNSFWMVERNE
jgi:hypothetical protein